MIPMKRYRIVYDCRASRYRVMSELVMLPVGIVIVTVSLLYYKLKNE